MLRTMAALVAVVGLAGCGPRMMPALVMPGETPESRDRDVMACRFEGTRAAAGVFHPNAMIAGAEQRNAEDRVFRACMMARGYREELRMMTFSEFMAAQDEGRQGPRQAPFVK